ncbi:MAG: RNA polymerase recycling motor HelD [Bacillota bacterium]|nr:RNA polymerase recycling motor HelD [Bacillota bacterium]
MDKENMKEEKEYLYSVNELLQYLLKVEIDKLSGIKKEVISFRKDMWENSIHYTNDFDRLTEMNQYLQQEHIRTAEYESARKNVEMFKTLIESPYFGRVDFIEKGEEEVEKVYIGKGNITDPKTGRIYVYDWRAPISSMYYRFEHGKASFKAPFGEIEGEITLKRQYKIVEANLKYFFDCSIQISDEILQDVLGSNSSTKMRSIIETIQKEQDMVIRDSDNDLLIVQGVAGSGKTSIALHRIAFLLYEGLNTKLSSNNILILSPNDAFNNYISHVLPELGEENVERTTMEAIVSDCLKNEMAKYNLEFAGRNRQLEQCIGGRSKLEGEKVSRWVEFKNSDTFKEIIDRYLRLYERKLIQFEDVYYGCKLIMSKSELKSSFLNNKTGVPVAKRLERLKNRLLDMIVELRKDRLYKLEKITQRSEGHEFEIKSFARLLLMKDSKAFETRINKFTELDVFFMYKNLFKSKEQFYKIAKGLSLPDDIDEIIEHSYKDMAFKKVHYEDLTAIAYMKLRVFGNEIKDSIRQVVIDEVQDYYPIQIAIIKELYLEARFTVVGDIAQTIEKNSEVSIYDSISKILDKKKAIRLSLNKSYRSSYEINEFAKKIYNLNTECISFPRFEEAPEVVSAINEEGLIDILLVKMQRYLEEGFETLVILCKTMKQSELLYGRIKDRIKIRIVNGNEEEADKGCMIMPIYAAKGLEFDAVLVYGTDDFNFCSEMDRRLLYIACTRALHRLSLYYEGEKSRFLNGVI